MDIYPSTVSLGVNMGDNGSVVSNVGPGTLSYAADDSAIVGDGTISSGSSSTLYGKQFLFTASSTRCIVNVTPIPVSPVVADLKRQAYMPAGAIDETVPHNLFLQDMAGILTAGTLQLSGYVVIPAGRIVTSITMLSGTTAANGPTAQWFSLVRQSDRSVLAKTVDDTSTAWAANTFKTLALSTPFQAQTNEVCYLGVVVTASVAVPTLAGASVNTASFNSKTPAFTGTSTTGLTNPASLGATAGAITATSQSAYGYIL
jgi:hypothetical protein